jgi:hypothetical protein
MSKCAIDGWNTLLDAGKPGMACTLTIRFLVKSFRTLSILVSRCLKISFQMSNTDERHGITTIQYFWSILITSSPRNSSWCAHQYWGVPNDLTKILNSLFSFVRNLTWMQKYIYKYFWCIFLFLREVLCQFLKKIEKCLPHFNSDFGWVLKF